MKTQWIAGAAVVVGAFVLLLTPAFDRNSTATTPVATTVTAAGAQTAVFAVQRLSCGACIDNIRQAVEQLDGITAVETDLAQGRTTVRFDPARATPARIAEVITAAGYPAMAVAAAPASPASQATLPSSGCGGGCCGRTK